MGRKTEIEKILTPFWMHPVKYILEVYEGALKAEGYRTKMGDVVVMAKWPGEERWYTIDMEGNVR